MIPGLPQHTENKGGGDKDTSPATTKIVNGSTPANPTAVEYHAPTGSPTVASLITQTAQVAVTTSSGGGGAGGGPPTFQTTTTDNTPLQKTVTFVALPFVVTPATVASITSGSGDHTGPVMSASGNVVYDPDGIVYFYDRQDQGTIRVSSNDGLTYSAQTISSDGRYIVYQGTDGTNTYVFVYGTDPAGAAIITSRLNSSPAPRPQSAAMAAPSWSSRAAASASTTCKVTSSPRSRLPRADWRARCGSRRSAPTVTSSRLYSWDLSAGVTQQIAPRVSVQVDYIRRSWGNLPATINRAWTPADFDSFVYNVPADPRLPGGGNYPLTFYDVKPGKFQQLDNFLTFADNVGGAFNSFNGVDFTVNARLPGVTLQGGTSTGNVVEDSCGVVAKHPEFYIFGPWGGTDPFLDTFLGGVGQWPQAFCHRESGWQTNVKGLATYTVPKIDVLISGTFRSLPYPGSEFPSVQSQSIGGQVTALFLGVPEFDRPTSGGRSPVAFPSKP